MDETLDDAPAVPADEEPVDNSVDSSVDDDLIRTVLADAQRVSRTLPRARPKRRSKPGSDGSTRGGYSDPGPDPDRDPQPLGALMAGYVDQRGWQRPLAEARVFTDWPGLVGADIAAHCTPQALRDGQLQVAAVSTAWATQLRLLGAALLARLVDELGPQVVTKLIVTGPVAPSWKHGNRAVRGHRGPRDTYG